MNIMIGCLIMKAKTILVDIGCYSNVVHTSKYPFIFFLFKLKADIEHFQIQSIHFPHKSSIHPVVGMAYTYHVSNHIV